MQEFKKPPKPSSSSSSCASEGNPLKLSLHLLSFFQVQTDVSISLAGPRAAKVLPVLLTHSAKNRYCWERRWVYPVLFTIVIWMLLYMLHTFNPTPSTPPSGRRSWLCNGQWV